MIINIKYFYLLKFAFISIVQAVMGKLVAFFLDRPILVNLIVIAILGLGIINMYSARKEGFPEISLNKVIIQTIYPGASARDVEINVTVKIEEALEKVENIKEVISTSEESMSIVTVEADNDATPVQFRKLYNDIEQAISEIQDLPKDIEGKPTLSEFTSKDIPIMLIAYKGEYAILKPYIDRLEGKLKRISGVGFVDVVGLPDREVQILVDPIKAKKMKVGLRSIYQAIQNRNLEGSGGTLESFTSEKKVVFLNKFENYEEVLDTNIVKNVEGLGVKLKDVATLKIIPKDLKLIVRNNGERGAILSVKKTGSSDLIKVVDKINDVLSKEKLPKGISQKILVDQSNFTRDRIGLLLSNALMGFILVSLILLAVFNIKTAVWTAFGIPFTMLFLLIILNKLSISLNLISLGGFIIIIGMLVDDAIVIAEEISSNKELGMEPKEAAIKAVQKMWIPVTGAVLTTMIAFSPLLSIGGFPGKFVWTIPLMVILGLVVSVFESFFLLPAHLCHGKAEKGDKKKFIIVLENYYKSILRLAIRLRYVVILVFVLMLFASIFVMKNYILKDPFPQEAAEGFTISLTTPKGSSLEGTEKVVTKAEKILLKLPENELIGISTRVGTQSELATTSRGAQSNVVIIFVYLKPFSGRDRTAEEIMVDVEKALNDKVKGELTEFSVNLTRLGPPMGKPLEVRVISNDDKRRGEVSQQIQSYLKTIDGVFGVETDEVDGKDELNIIIDHDILSQTGLSVQDVLSTLRIAFDGQIVTDMTTLDESLEFRLRLNEKGRGDQNFIKKLPILNRSGNLINLGVFTSIEEQPSQAKFTHINGERSTTVMGNTDLGKISPVDVTKLVAAKFADIEGMEISFSGQSVETKAIFASLGSSMVIAIVGIFLVITLILNSYSKPLIIMTPLPFILIGVVISLLTHGLPMSMLAGVATVGLMGVVVNDSIVMVHRIEEKILKGFELHLLLEASADRLRPVLLTTITTVFGVLPTGYGWGGYDPFLSQMCIVTAYGLMFSSLIILFVVPIVYHIVYDITKCLKKQV